MALVWQIEGNGLQRLSEDDTRPDARRGTGRVVLMGASEAAERFSAPAVAELLHDLPHAALSFAECTGRSAMGIVVAPSESCRQRETERFGFVLVPGELVFIDAGGLAARLMEGTESSGVAPVGPASVLAAVLRALVRDHPALLSEVREDYELFEEDVLGGGGRPNRALMMEDARRLLGLDTFYQGLSDILSYLLEGAGEAVAPAERQALESLARQVDRLSARLEALRSYSLQVDELYQESIDVRQNNVMQWLTVVTTIAMPLTFITGWYGMNFPHMAALDAPWGYPAVLALCVAVVVSEVLFFRRRGWLSFGGARRRRGRGGGR